MITLPFPPFGLNPNRRTHWAKHARAFKGYKFQCFALLSQYRDELRGMTAFSLEFRPPDARRRDADNLMAASKALIDALAEVTGVDDSKFSFSVAMGSRVDGGAVVVAVNAQRAAA